MDLCISSSWPDRPLNWQYYGFGEQIHVMRKSNICIWLPVHSGEMSTCDALGKGRANFCFTLEDRMPLG